MRLETVYPRVCGGTADRLRTEEANAGLSPRVRGNHALAHHHLAHPRSIPACAGEPTPSPLSAPLPRVYPRVCGGTALLVGKREWPAGLSPRVRGNPETWEDNAMTQGSIPACAGEPARESLALKIMTVYPRVCGGTSTMSAALPRMHGLSPRVRGNPIPRPRRARAGGSIPACAGEPLEAGGADLAAEVYPRVCGGTTTEQCRQLRAEGLSPRVRGNQFSPRGDS